MSEGRQARKNERPARVLLRPVHAIGKLLIGFDLIDLRGGLVHLSGPGDAAVGGDVRPAVIRLDHEVRVVGVDPEIVIVAVRRVQRLESPAAVGGLEEAFIVHEDRVRVLRMCVNVRVVEGPAQEALLVRLAAPCSAGIVGTVQSALVPGRFDERVDTFWIRRGNVEIDLPDEPLRQTADELGPCLAAVDGLVDARARFRLAAANDRPGLSLSEPEGGIKLFRIRRVHRHGGSSESFIHVENLLPRRSTIVRAIHASLGAWGPGESLRRGINGLRVLRMHSHLGDLAGVAKPRVRPGLARIARAIDAAAEDHVAADAIASGTHVHDLGIRLGHVDRADGSGFEETIRDRAPCLPIVSGLENSAARSALIESAGLHAVARDRGNSAAPGGADHAVAQPRQKFRLDSTRPSLRAGGRFKSHDGEESEADEREVAWFHLDLRKGFNVP